MADVQQVYPECTDCNKLLGDKEITINRKMENYYYPICDDCMNRTTDRILKIVYGES